MGEQRTKIPYFPGCTLSTKAVGFDVAGRAAAEALGFELVELSQWNCCGATFPLAVDNELALVGPTRILLQAQRESTRLATLCSICYNVLRRTAGFLRENEEKRERINLFVEEAYRGEVRVLHLLEILRDELGFEALSERIASPLEGLRCAPYYGCLLLRPQSEIGLDDPDEPTILHDLLASLGCEVVDFPYKTECCGSYLTVSAAAAAEELAYAILRSAQQEGAEMVATSCPLCQFNLDYRQAEMDRKHPDFTPLPVLYFTQLLGIALGLDSTDYGFGDHYVDPRPLLREKGLVV
ncbi:MAG: CoB--CoM heterodisulfide reductase iron-sulfur subunit B family protein [Anaerolineae bacterium]|nr:CoB--CoM heterodisulfide reductase iron-sulfur subunit B family protein [Anaerolineae bacterium]